MRKRFIFFFFNDTATTEIYTLSLHDALPILRDAASRRELREVEKRGGRIGGRKPEQFRRYARSEEHTSELQSRQYLVCCLLLEKKKIYPSFLSLHLFSLCQS